jgi:hypothetical protein
MDKSLGEIRAELGLENMAEPIQQSKKGCVLKFTDKRTGQAWYGCQKSEQWLIEKEIPSLRYVATFDEAREHPFLVAGYAQALADALMGNCVHVAYQIVYVN